MIEQRETPKQIETETLRQWLDTRRPFTVVDVRRDEDRSQWAIPGSVHVNAYEALRGGQPGVLADIDLPRDPESRFRSRRSQRASESRSARL